METTARIGDILPARRLRPLSGGPAVAIGPNRSSADVLVVTHEEPCPRCAAYLCTFGDLTGRLAAEKATVLALVGSAWAEQPPAVPAAVTDDRVLEVLAPGGTPTVVVADRFGQVFGRFDAGPDHHFPEPEEILNLLLNIAISCPECGVPDVPCQATLPAAGAMSGGMRLGG